MEKPKEVNILGIVYKISYVDNPAEVDLHQRESLWGEIDFWTRTIRIYDHGRGEIDIWETILHEVLHGIVQKLHLSSLKKKENHDELERLSLALTDVLYRNGWFKKETFEREAERTG